MTLSLLLLLLLSVSSLVSTSVASIFTVVCHGGRSFSVSLSLSLSLLFSHSLPLSLFSFFEKENIFSFSRKRYVSHLKGVFLHARTDSINIKKIKQRECQSVMKWFQFSRAFSWNHVKLTRVFNSLLGNWSPPDFSDFSDFFFWDRKEGICVFV